MKKLFLIAFILFQGLCILLTIIKPSKALSPYISGYIIHFLAVSISVILLYLVLESTKHKQALLIAFIYGLFITLAGEYIQSFLSYRTFDYKDIATGIIATSISSSSIFIKNKI
jgi:hypothetical protein